jgi:hypothetical protein
LIILKETQIIMILNTEISKACHLSTGPIPCKLKSCILILSKSMKLVIFELANINWAVLKLDLPKPIFLTAFEVSYEVFAPWNNQFAEAVKFIIYEITFVNKLGLYKLAISISYSISEISDLLIAIEDFPKPKSGRKRTKKYRSLVIFKFSVTYFVIILKITWIFISIFIHLRTYAMSFKYFLFL